MPAFSGKRTFTQATRRFLATGRPALGSWARRGYFAPDLPDPVERVLLIASGWLGDTFWASQVVPPLVERIGRERVWVATHPRSIELWRGLVADPNVVPVENVISDRRREPFSWAGLWEESARLRAAEFDVVLDTMCNRYSALATFLARPRRGFGCAGHELDALYSEALAAPPGAAHLSLRPWHVLQPFLGPPPETPPPTRQPPQATSPLPDDLGVPTRPFAVLAPGAGWQGKCWPVDRYAELAASMESLGLGVVTVGAEWERHACEAVAARAPGGLALPGLGIQRLPALLSRARLVVCNDSATSHLAAAVGAPVVALFSATNPARSRPLGPRVEVVRGDCPYRPEGDELHCTGDRPAHPCPTSCWDAVTVERVLVASRRVLLA